MVVAWITDPIVIGRIVTQRKRAGLESPFAARGPTCRALERHSDDDVYAHAERFEERHGALRKSVPRSVTRDLECGRLLGGFARIRCPTCRDEHLLAFSRLEPARATS